MRSTKSKLTTGQAAEILLSAQSVALFSHVRPDGDTVGAASALCLALRKAGKNVALFCSDELSDGLKKFPLSLQYSQTFFGKYDLMVAVDCGDVFRLGDFSGVYDRFFNTMTIDHHGGETYSRYSCLENYASTCQIIYEILPRLQVEMDEEIATYLYMGLCTDTGNFSNSSTDAASFAMAAELCRHNADRQKVYRVFFSDTTFGVARLWGKAMSCMRSYYDGKLILLYITAQDLKQYGAQPSDSEGIVQNAIAVDTAIGGVSLCEYAENSFKVSMRGKDFNVRDICRQFGGNGHVVAAGCMINGLLEDVIEKIVRAFGIAFEDERIC